MHISVAKTDVHVCTLHTLDLGTVQSDLLSEYLGGAHQLCTSHQRYVCTYYQYWSMYARELGTE